MLGDDGLRPSCRRATLGTRTLDPLIKSPADKLPTDTHD